MFGHGSIISTKMILLIHNTINIPKPNISTTTFTNMSKQFSETLTCQNIPNILTRWSAEDFRRDGLHILKDRISKNIKDLLNNNTWNLLPKNLVVTNIVEKEVKRFMLTNSQLFHGITSKVEVTKNKIDLSKFKVERNVSTLINHYSNNNAVLINEIDSNETTIYITKKIKDKTNLILFSRFNEITLISIRVNNVIYPLNIRLRDRTNFNLHTNRLLTEDNLFAHWTEADFTQLPENQMN